MPSLRELQKAMRDHAFDKGGTDAAASAVSDVHPIAPAERLNIHRNATLLGFGAAMSALFPVVTRLVGEDFFDYMARAFLKANPPEDPVLHRLGYAFPEFVQNFEPAASLPYLSDVARLEAAWTYAYHAADAQPINPESLLGFPEDQLGDVLLTPLPSTRFVTSSYPVSAIWEANLPDTGSSDEISLDDGGETILIYRPDTDVIVRPVSSGAFSFLMALSAHQNISAALDSALSIDPMFQFVEELRTLLLARCFQEARLP